MKTNLFRSFVAAISASLSICAAYASTTEVDDTDGTIAYSGGTWTSDSSDGVCYDGTQHYIATLNASAQYSFTGTAITWIGALWNNQGLTDVYIDGVHQGDVDAYSSLDIPTKNLFERTSLSSGTHTIKLVCENKNSGTGSNNTFTNVDAFIYSTDSPWTGIKVDDRDTTDITFSGSGWTPSLFSTCYQGTENYTNSTGDYAQFAFIGTRIRWIGALWSDQGVADVYIDGVHQGTVDAYSASDLVQKNLFEKTGLSAGTHTIKVVCTGTNSGTGSTGVGLNVDAFEYGGTGTWTASTQLSSIQGQNQWYYQQRPQGGGTATNMLWNTGGFGLWWTSDQTGWMGSYQGVADTRPGSTSDTVRKWVAPYPTTVSITGRVYKLDTAQLKSAIFTVEKNGTSIWGPKTVTSTDTIGYTTDASLGTVSVNSGDSIAFIVNDNGSWADSWDGWDPTITEGPNPAWQLNTSDTLLNLGIIGNGPAIAQFKDANGSNWNWTPSPITLPLLNSVYIASAVNHPNWRYTTASVDTGSGTKVTLTFNSQSPSLTLTQVWWARPGVGPVEETQSITNNSGSTITIYDSDVIASDLTVTADNTVTVWQFDRSSVNDGGDPNYNTGTVKTTITSSTNFVSTISNNITTGAYFLPFEMLAVGGVHGCYIGYESDFGLITTSTSGNADVIRNVFQLWNSNSFPIANGTTIALPGMFYGAYTGDTDTGSNHMKKWFWDKKMTPTIISTSNEPLVEAAVNLNVQVELNSFFSPDYPSLASWGVESIKEDGPWADDYLTNAYDWTPNTSAGWWPNGFGDGSAAHSHGLKFVLYMANTFNGVDLSTTAGVTSEEGALMARYGTSPTAPNFIGGYDIWRSDITIEATANYLSHLGFLQVVDYMISNQSGFRWENCSAGGSKKSFDMLQRQSYMCVDDSSSNPGTLESYRKSYYASSYMINPVQLESQNIEFSGTEDNAAHGKYMFRLGFMGAWMNFLSKKDAPFSIQDTLYGQTVPIYKTYQRPRLRGADVYHILPICDSTHWDGIEYFNSALNKGSVVLFKPNSSVTTFPGVQLKGLIPTGTYSLSFQDRNTLNASYTSVSGSTLMSGAGIGSFSGTANEYDSEIIWINY